VKWEKNIMAIKRIEMKDFLVFRGGFSADFSHGVNIFIGGNGTGKTTLIKCIYAVAQWSLSDSKALSVYPYFSTTPYVRSGNVIYPQISSDSDNSFIFKHSKEDAENNPYFRLFLKDDIFISYCGEIPVPEKLSFPSWKHNWKDIKIESAYIPEKDILEHTKGLLTFIEQKTTGFSEVYRNVLIAAMDVPTRKQSETQKSVCQKVSDIIGGKVIWEQSEGSFYTLKTDGTKIPFVNEASGYKKIGYLGLLVASGQLKPGSVLIWDEPENSLNPELMPKIVEIMLELAKSGVQVFIATHSYSLTRWFDVKNNNNQLKFFDLYKNNGIIECVESENYTGLKKSVLRDADTTLFNAVVAKSIGDNSYE
jgi:energy-coupling factor transporter ATP-binding protein EcfA2